MSAADPTSEQQRLDEIVGRLFRLAVQAEACRRYAEALAAARADEDCGPNQAIARERMLAEERTRARTLLECYAEAEGLDPRVAAEEVIAAADKEGS